MRIRRSRLVADFVQIPNSTVRDDRLSYMARGILAELLSRPDGWESTADDLWQAARQARGDDAEGRRSFRAAFAELKRFGYMVAAREQGGGGRFETVLIVYDSPAQTEIPDAGTSVPPGQTGVRPGQTDMPHGGTSVPITDVPDAGTSEPPAETPIPPGRADGPPTGTSVPPAKTGVSPGRTDVPHAGTSNKKTGLENGKENSLSDDDEERASPKPIKTRARHAQDMVRATGLIGDHEIGPFVAWVTAERKPRTRKWWETVIANEDLPELIIDWYADRYPARQSGPRPYDRPLDEVLAAPDGVPRARDEDTTLRGASAAREALQTLRRPVRAGGGYQDAPDPSVYYEENLSDK